MCSVFSKKGVIHREVKPHIPDRVLTHLFGSKSQKCVESFCSTLRWYISMVKSAEKGKQGAKVRTDISFPDTQYPLFCFV